MASLPPPTPAALAIAPHFAPVIHTFATPELSSILARSKLGTVSQLLAAFENGVDRVNVRSTNYETRTLPRFPVHFVERTLPQGWVEAIGGGAVTSQRTRSGTVGSVAGHSPAITGLTPNTIGNVAAGTPATPQTSFSWPNQAERDELYLDSLSSLISSQVETWTHQTGREELDVREARPRPRMPDEGEEEPAPRIEPDEGWQGRSIDSLTPWYAAMRDEVFKRREMVEWETFAWPVGCLLALSTSHSDPLNALASLWDLTSKENVFARSSYPPRSGAEEDSRHDWANPDILRYIVLIHDHGAGGGRDALEDAQTLHETIRKTYGHHTALLPLFSAAPTATPPQQRARGLAPLWPELPRSSMPKPQPLLGLGVTQEVDDPTPQSPIAEPKESHEEIERGHEISDDDLKALRVFMRDMVTQSLIPWMERAVIVGNEQYNSSKRSIGGRLFSAGRKYFGGSATNSRSGSPVSAGGGALGYNATRGYYPHQTQESQSRRLADLAFMLGDYKLAASVYEQASKDYKTDRAWRYHSSACRMAGISQLLTHTTATPIPYDPDQWLQLAQQTSMTPSADLDGLRATMLYYEAYRLIEDWRWAPQGLLRCAGEVDEVPSAILLEQAAISDLHLPRVSRRKYAFHMTMAATRFEKCGLKSLSRRCLTQAASVFRVNPVNDGDPLYPSPDHIANWSAIRAHIHHSLGRQSYNVGNSDDALQHFLELLVGRDVGQADSVELGWLDDFALAWEHLGPDAARIVAERKLALPVQIFSIKEARIVSDRSGASDPADPRWQGLATAFATSSSATSSETTSGNEVILGETFHLVLKLINPLAAPLAIGGLELVTDATDSSVDIQAPQELELGPREIKEIYIPITTRHLNAFNLTAIRYRFHDMLPCVEPLGSRSSKPATDPVQTQGIAIKVRSPIPVLSIGLDDLPRTLFAGEARASFVTVTNTGQVALANLRAICSHPSFVVFSSEVLQTSRTATTVTISNELTQNLPSPMPQAKVLQPGEAVRLAVLCRGDSGGLHDVLLMFGFEDAVTKEVFTAKASHELRVQHSLEVRVQVLQNDSHNAPYAVSLDIRNAAIPSEVRITQVTSLGPSWRCQMLSGDDSSQKPSLLGSRQALNVILEVSSHPADLLQSAAFSVEQLDKLLQGQDVTSKVPAEVSLQLSSSTMDSSPLIDVAASAPLLASVLHTHRALRSLELSARLPTVAPSLHRHLFPAFESRSIDLLVFWTVPSTGARGHHHLTGIPLGASTNRLRDVLDKAELKAGGLYAESQRERTALLAGLRRSELGTDEDPARVSVAVNEFVTHDFATGPCTVPIVFRITNLSMTESFRYTLALADLSNALPANAVFAGSMRHRGSVEPLQTVDIATRLWIAREGTYEVGGWQIEVERDEVRWTSQGRRQQICVSDSSPDTRATLGAGPALVDVSA